MFLLDSQDVASCILSSNIENTVDIIPAGFEARLGPETTAPEE